MTKQTRQGCILMLISIIVLLPLTERFLRIGDPLGASRYYLDLGELFAGYVYNEARGYSMYPGDYTFSNWTAQIDAQGNRAVPDSKDSDCTLTFVGDSVAFGFGVSDTETFVNLIAQQIDARVINTAIPAYNSENVRRVIESTPANGYVYVLISNDDEYTRTRQNTAPIPFNAEQDVFGAYLDAITHLNASFARDSERFEADLAALMARDDMLIVRFQDRHWQNVNLPDAIPLLPAWQHSNSFIDGHANAAGQAEIAAAMLPYVETFEGRVCG